MSKVEDEAKVIWNVTLRDRFAMAAMRIAQAMASDPDERARIAFRMADAMIEARTRTLLERQVEGRPK